MQSAGVQQVAGAAGVAVGTVYRHFPSKGELFAEVFRQASQRELDVVVDVTRADGRDAAERIGAAVEAFSRRALAGRVRPTRSSPSRSTPPSRRSGCGCARGYRDAFASVLDDGVRAGELRPHDTRTVAAALVGALAESLVGPALRPPALATPETLIETLVQLCQEALPHARQPRPRMRFSTRRRRWRPTTSSTPTSRCARRSSARAAAGAWTACATPASWPARSRRSSTPSAPSATSRACAPTTATATASTTVELDPSWHWLLRQAIEREIHSLPWREPEPGRARGARGADVRLDAGQRRRDVPGLDDLLGDPRAARRARAGRRMGAAPDPRRATRTARWPGMAMTEKQGGSDVRANTTRAEPAGDGDYEITGHKWFCSYPPCDIFLTLAQAPGGLSCFLIEGERPGLPDPAPQGQARHPLAALERGRVPRRAGPPGGRGGPRRGRRSSGWSTTRGSTA